MENIYQRSVSTSDIFTYKHSPLIPPSLAFCPLSSPPLHWIKVSRPENWFKAEDFYNFWSCHPSYDCFQARDEYISTKNNLIYILVYASRVGGVGLECKEYLSIYPLSRIDLSRCYYSTIQPFVLVFSSLSQANQ